MIGFQEPARIDRVRRWARLRRSRLPGEVKHGISIQILGRVETRARDLYIPEYGVGSVDKSIAQQVRNRYLVKRVPAIAVPVKRRKIDFACVRRHIDLDSARVAFGGTGLATVRIRRIHFRSRLLALALHGPSRDNQRVILAAAIYTRGQTDRAAMHVGHLFNDHGEVPRSIDSRG